MQLLGADRDGDRRDAFGGEAQAAVPAAPPHGTHLGGRDASDQEGPDLPVLREEPVRLAQAGHGADLRGLLATARRVQGEFTLTLKIYELDIEFTGDDHHFVEPRQCLGRQLTIESRLGSRGSVGGDELHRTGSGHTHGSLLEVAVRHVSPSDL